MNGIESNRWFIQAHPQIWKKIESMRLPPSFRIHLAKNGDPALQHKGISLHSGYNPGAEAEGFAGEALKPLPAGAVVVVLGLGLGYHIDAVRARFTGEIIVVEPELGIVKAALESRPQSGLKESTLLAELHVDEAVQSIIDASGGDLHKVHIISHPPSFKINTEYFSELRRRIRARMNLASGRLGILVVTPVYGGSLPVARHCAAAFKRLGHRVELLDNEIYDAARRQIESVTGNRAHRRELEAMLTHLMAETVTARALDRAVDLVFAVAQSPMSAQVIRELKLRKIPVAFWFMEDWRLFSYWREWAPQYDYFFSIQKGEFIAALTRIGVSRAHCLPLAADPLVHRPVKLTPLEIKEFGSEVSHVGAGYRNRRQVFSGLTDLDFKLWGNDWERGTSLEKILQRNGERLSEEDYVKVFNGSKINLNLHSSAFHDGVNPEGDFVNPRTFEIAASGAFQLVDRRALLPEYFDTARELAVFGDASELRGLIEYYLKNPELRREYAKAARSRVLADHTYEMRMAEALSIIYSHETVPASRLHPDHIDNLLSEADGDPDLQELLRRFAGRGVVTLDEIAADIHRRDGDLTQAEALFLLMYEFRRWAKEKEIA